MGQNRSQNGRYIMKTALTHRSIHCQLPRAITFDQTVRFLSSIPFQKLEVKIFPRVSRSTPFEKLHRWCPFQGPPPRKACQGYKRPQAPPRPKKKVSLGSALCLDFFYTFFLSLSNTKNTSKPLDSSFFIKNTKYCSYTQSSSPWFYTLDLGFRGVDVAFLAIIHTHNFLNLFLEFILLFYALIT